MLYLEKCNTSHKNSVFKIKTETKLHTKLNQNKLYLSFPMFAILNSSLVSE